MGSDTDGGDFVGDSSDGADAPGGAFTGDSSQGDDNGGGAFTGDDTDGERNFGDDSDGGSFLERPLDSAGEKINYRSGSGSGEFGGLRVRVDGDRDDAIDRLRDKLPGATIAPDPDDDQVILVSVPDGDIDEAANEAANLDVVTNVEVRTASRRGMDDADGDRPDGGGLDPMWIYIIAGVAGCLCCSAITIAVIVAHRRKKQAEMDAEMYSARDMSHLDSLDAGMDGTGYWPEGHQ